MTVWIIQEAGQEAESEGLHRVHLLLMFRSEEGTLLVFKKLPDKLPVWQSHFRGLGTSFRVLFIYTVKTKQKKRLRWKRKHPTATATASNHIVSGCSVWRVLKFWTSVKIQVSLILFPQKDKIAFSLKELLRWQWNWCVPILGDFSSRQPSCGVHSERGKLQCTVHSDTRG